MSTHFTKKLQTEYEDFMKDLTPKYRTRVISERMEEITKRNFILQSLIQKYVSSFNIDIKNKPKRTEI